MCGGPINFRRTSEEARAASEALHQCAIAGYDAIYAHLCEPKNRAKFEAAVKAWRVYYGSDRFVFRGELRRLARKDKREWSWLLLDLHDSAEDIRRRFYEPLRAFSPFAKMKIVYGKDVDYKVWLSGDVREFFEHVGRRKLHYLFAADNMYLLAFTPFKKKRKS